MKNGSEQHGTVKRVRLFLPLFLFIRIMTDFVGLNQFRQFRGYSCHFDLFIIISQRHLLRPPSFMHANPRINVRASQTG